MATLAWDQVFYHYLQPEPLDLSVLYIGKDKLPEVKGLEIFIERGKSWKVSKFETICNRIESTYQQAKADWNV